MSATEDGEWEKVGPWTEGRWTEGRRCLENEGMFVQGNQSDSLSNKINDMFLKIESSFLMLKS